MPSTSELLKLKKGRMLWVLPVSLRILLCGPLTEFQALTLRLHQFGVGFRRFFVCAVVVVFLYIIV